MASKAAGESQEAPKIKVFISYSRKDIAFADRLDAALKARNFEPLIDRSEIYAFEDWWARIQALIAQADTVIFVLSPEAVASPVCTKEVAFAASLNKRFAPVVLRQVDDKSVPEALARLNFIFFDNEALFEDSLDRLCDALQTDIEWIRQHTEYGEAERRWSAAGRPNGLLLRSPTLEVAEHWLVSRPRGAPEPTAEIRTFVAASRQGARSAERLRRIVQASIFALLIAIIVGLVGWTHQKTIADQWRWWTVTVPYAAVQVRPYILSGRQERALKPGDSFRECAQACPEMVVVPAGSLNMGASVTESQSLGYEIEIPQHLVAIAKPFAVSKYESTFDDWDACVAGGGCDGYKPNDDHWGGGRQPVIYVNFNDAQRYVAWLSAVTGKTYRLLSEAEFEYATRAGTTTAFPWGDEIQLNGTAMANCVGCGSKWENQQPAPVGSFPPNRFGLYDMVGNVWEWVADCAHLTYKDAPKNASPWLTGADCNLRMIRSGGWFNSSDYIRSAARDGYTAVGRLNRLGFRVARTLTP